MKIVPYKDTISMTSHRRPYYEYISYTVPLRGKPLYNNNCTVDYKRLELMFLVIMVNKTNILKKLHTLRMYKPL